MRNLRTAARQGRGPAIYTKQNGRPAGCAIPRRSAAPISLDRGGGRVGGGGLLVFVSVSFPAEPLFPVLGAAPSGRWLAPRLPGAGTLPARQRLARDRKCYRSATSKEDPNFV